MLATLVIVPRLLLALAAAFAMGLVILLIAGACKIVELFEILVWIARR